jgi:nucleosome assembly protein 1-like 1
VNETYYDDFVSLLMKYEEKRNPLLLDRKKLINSKNEEGKFVGLPNFWKIVLENSELSTDIYPQDQDSLSYIEDICFVVNEKGYTIEIHYLDNPYFTNKSLIKYFYKGEGEKRHNVIDCQGTKIEWKEGKDLTKKEIIKKKKNKGGGKTKVKKYVEQESFYLFFNILKLNEEMEETSEELYIKQSIVLCEAEIGSTFRESIIPNAVDYYLGKIKIEKDLNSSINEDIE